MTKIQIVKVANSLEMFRIYFFDIGICLSFIHCHFPMDAFGRSFC